MGGSFKYFFSTEETQKFPLKINNRKEFSVIAENIDQVKLPSARLDTFGRSHRRQPCKLRT